MARPQFLTCAGRFLSNDNCSACSYAHQRSPYRSTGDVNAISARPLLMWRESSTFSDVQSSLTSSGVAKLPEPNLFTFVHTSLVEFFPCRISPRPLTGISTIPCFFACNPSIFRVPGPQLEFVYSWFLHTNRPGFDAYEKVKLGLESLIPHAPILLVDQLHILYSFVYGQQLVQ